MCRRGKGEGNVFPLKSAPFPGAALQEREKHARLPGLPLSGHTGLYLPTLLFAGFYLFRCRSQESIENSFRVTGLHTVTVFSFNRLSTHFDESYATLNSL